MSRIDPRDVRRAAKEAAAQAAEDEDRLADALRAEVEQQPPQKVSGPAPRTPTR